MKKNNTIVAAFAIIGFISAAVIAVCLLKNKFKQCPFMSLFSDEDDFEFFDDDILEESIAEEDKTEEEPSEVIEEKPAAKVRRGYIPLKLRHADNA